MRRKTRQNEDSTRMRVMRKASQMRYLRGGAWKDGPEVALGLPREELGQRGMKPQQEGAGCLGRREAGVREMRKGESRLAGPHGDRPGTSLSTTQGTDHWEA